jgi:hypothetical protein
MKRFFLAVLLSSFICSASAQNSPAPPRTPGSSTRYIVKMNPLALLIGRYSFAFEYRLDDRSSFGLEGSAMDWDIPLESRTFDFSVSGYRISPQYRYYVTYATKEAPRGFYVAPFAEYSSYTLKVSRLDSAYGLGTATSNITIFGAGANIGIQWVLGKAIAIDLYGGVGYSVGGLDRVQIRYSNPSAPSSTIVIPNAVAGGFVPNLGFAVGYAF